MKLGNVLLVFSVALALVGCPAASDAPPPAHCTKLYAQCKLPQGPLGVCTDTPCQTPSDKGCLTCTSQH